MAFDFKHLPGGGGAVGPVITGLDAGINAALCVGFLDIFACFRAVVDIFSLVFDLFFDNIFQGRPKVGPHSATDAVALFFIPSQNPVISLWGMGIRILEAKGFALSASGPPGSVYFQQLATAVRADLERQFGITQGALYFEQYGYLQSLNNPDSNGPALEGRQKVDQHYRDAVQKRLIDPKTGFPPPGIKPPPPPQPSKTPCTDPCQENLQFLITSEIIPAFESISAGLWRIAPSLGASDSSATPTTIEQIKDCICALEGIIQVGLGQITQQLARPGATDLSGVVAQLRRIADDLSVTAGTPTKRPAYSPFVQDLVNQAQALRKNTANVLATVRPDLAQILSS